MSEYYEEGNCVRCLRSSPIASLLGFILVLIGGGAFGGATIFARRYLIKLLDASHLLPYLDCAVYGLVGAIGLFTLVAYLLCSFSSGLNAKRCFESSRKAICGRCCNMTLIMCLVFGIILWTAIACLVSYPVISITLLYHREQGPTRLRLESVRAANEGLGGMTSPPALTYRSLQRRAITWPFSATPEPPLGWDSQHMGQPEIAKNEDWDDSIDSNPEDTWHSAELENVPSESGTNPSTGLRQPLVTNKASPGDELTNEPLPQSVWTNTPAVRKTLTNQPTPIPEVTNESAAESLLSDAQNFTERELFTTPIPAETFNRPQVDHSTVTNPISFPNHNQFQPNVEAQNDVVKTALNVAEASRLFFKCNDEQIDLSYYGLYDSKGLPLKVSRGKFNDQILDGFIYVIVALAGIFFLLVGYLQIVICVAMNFARMQEPRYYETVEAGEEGVALQQ